MAISGSRTATSRSSPSNSARRSTSSRKISCATPTGEFRDAFRSHYPDVEILFANKSNNGLAIRHIMNQEGAGGDCFGVNEMYLALLAGTEPEDAGAQRLEQAARRARDGDPERALHQHRRDGRARPHRRHLPTARQGGRYRNPPEARSRAARQSLGRRDARARHHEGAERQHQMGHVARARPWRSSSAPRPCSAST